MKKLLPVLCVALLLGAEKKDVKKDDEKLQGKWVLKSAERGGKPVDIDKDEHIPRSITFKGDKMTVELKNGGEHAGSFKLGREEKLGTLDLTPDDADKKDHLVKALYKMDGDTLTVCVNEGKLSERPKEVGAKEGSHCVVIVFKRDTK